MIQQRIRINLIPGNVPVRVMLNQYDHDRNALAFTFYQGTQQFSLAGCSVSIQATKSDFKGFTFAGTVSGNTAIFDVDIQMTAAAGEFPAEVRIKNGSNEIGTANFIMCVEKAPLGEDTDISETVLPDIIDAATRHMEAAAASAEAAAASEAGAAASAGNASGSASAAAASAANAAISEANAAASESDAASSAADSADSALLSESWAVGHTGSRSGEDTNNSEYWAGRSGTYAAAAKNEADRASQYADFVTPVYIIQDNRLYLKDEAVPEWAVTNNRLYIKLVA